MICKTDVCLQTKIVICKQLMVCKYLIELTLKNPDFILFSIQNALWNFIWWI